MGGGSGGTMLSAELQTWLLDGTDPSLRLRVLRELLDRPDDDAEVRKAREEIGTTGWAASILKEQLPPGQWAGPGTSDDELYRPKYIATNWRLLVLADLGVTRETAGVGRAVELYFGSDEYRTTQFAGPSAEVCFTGNCVRMFAQFGYAHDPRLGPAIQWLVDSQKSDGGWHCFPSETGTLDGWEALAAFAYLPADLRTAAVHRAIERGADFYLDRELLREGEGTYEPWRRFHYPTHYYYDLLVGLDMLTRLGYGRDPRLRSALDLLEGRRNSNGTWSLDALHPDFDGDYRISSPFYPFALERPGRPSGWITATALAVLRRAGRG